MIKENTEMMMSITLELAEKIFKRMAASGKGLSEACKHYDVDYYDFLLSVNEDKLLSQIYFEHKQKQCIQMQEYVEEQVRDIETYFDQRGVKRADPGMIAIANMRVKTYQYMLERLKPKFYNLRLQELEQMSANDLSEEIRQQYQQLKEKYQSEY